MLNKMISLKKNLLFLSLLQDKVLFTIISLLTFLGIGLCVGQAIRYSQHGGQWWFETITSNTQLFLVFSLITVCLAGRRICIRKGRGYECQDEGKIPARHLILDKFYFIFAYCTLIAILLFPIMMYYGFSLIQLLATYLYCIGVVNVCTFPIVVCREKERLSDFEMVNFSLFKQVISYIVLLLAIGVYWVVDEWSGKWNIHIAVIVLSCLGITALLLHRFFVQLVVRMYAKD